eukprot:7883692-Heterocapsa_arctica.AAC.1
MRKAPTYWQQFFAQMMTEQGWTGSLNDPQVFVHRATGSVLVAHVDEIVMTSAKDEEERLRNKISGKMNMKWGEEVRLGAWT